MFSRRDARRSFLEAPPAAMTAVFEANGVKPGEVDTVVDGSTVTLCVSVVVAVVAVYSSQHIQLELTS